MRIYYDIDTQNDFMNKDGALYVPNAESIKENIKNLTDHARKRKIQITGSMDDHPKDDPEFKIFPPHCISGTYGQKKIFPIAPGDLYFTKQSYDIFTNHTFEKFLDRERVSEAIVYGVATDYCVKAAVLGMQNLGIQCYVITDAIKSITLEGEKQAMKEMTRAGAKLRRTKHVLEDMI